MVAAQVANQWRGKGQSVKLRDFLPDFWDERKQSPRDIIAAAQMFAAQCAARGRA
jgi:hypothetical protein